MHVALGARQFQRELKWLGRGEGSGDGVLRMRDRKDVMMGASRAGLDPSALAQPVDQRKLKSFPPTGSAPTQPPGLV